MQSRKAVTPQSKSPMTQKLKQFTQPLNSNIKVESMTHSVSTPTVLQSSSSKIFQTPKKTDPTLKASPVTDPSKKTKSIVNKSVIVSPSNSIKSGIKITKSPAKDPKITTLMLNLQKPAIERPTIPKLANTSAFDIDLDTTLSNGSAATKNSLNVSYTSTPQNANSNSRIGIRPQTCLGRKGSENQFFQSNSGRNSPKARGPSLGIMQKVNKSQDLSRMSLDFQKQQIIGKEVVKSAAPAINFPYRWLFFGPHVSYEKAVRHLVMVYKGLYYVINSLKPPSMGFVESKQVNLPPRLADETLIHSCRNYEQPDATIDIRSSRDQLSRISIKIRPHIEEFFKKVNPYYEIVVFTAASRSYARAIVEYLDKDRKYISQLFTREDCMETQSGFHIKDLRIFRERDLSELVIVDNLIHSFGFQIDNGIPIIEYYGDKNDQELLHLADYLLKAKDAKDIRLFNREQLLLHKMLQKDFDSIQRDIYKAFYRPLDKTIAELYVAS